MDEKLLEILSASGQISEQKLLDYLQGKLSPEESHEIEKLLADSDFVNEAAEGLGEVKDKNQIPAVLNELNRQLVKKLSKKRKLRLKKKMPDLIIPVVTTIILLFLILMIYLIMRNHYSH